MRHTFATASIVAGDDISSVSSNLGHYSTVFTMDTYAHFTEEAKKKSASRLQAYIENLGDPEKL